MHFLAMDDTLGDEQIMHRRGCLGALGQPVHNALLFERGGFRLGMMGAQNLELSGLWLAPLFGQNNPKSRIIAPPRPLKPDSQHDKNIVQPGKKVNARLVVGVLLGFFQFQGQ